MSFLFLAAGGRQSEGGVRPREMFLYQQNSLAPPAHFTAGGYASLQSEHSGPSTRDRRECQHLLHSCNLSSVEQWGGIALSTPVISMRQVDRVRLGSGVINISRRK